MASHTNIGVLIAGGGPTGLTLGALLARFGVESLVVERNSSTCTHPQAHSISGRTMEIFRSLGIERAVRERGLDLMKNNGIRLVTSLTGIELAHLQMPLTPQLIDAMRALSPCPRASTPQDLVEPLLLEQLLKHSGQIRFNTQLTGFDQDGAGVSATVVSNGQEERIRAQWLIGCDGASSPVRKRLAIATNGPDTLGHILGIYFPADLSRWTRERPAMLYWTIDAQHPAVFIALDGSKRWSLHVPWDPATESLEDYTDQRCTDIARHCIGADVAIDMHSVLPWAVNAQIAETYRKGRVILAGDAAHRFPPSGGSGLNAGVQDAHNLAWKLAAVAAGKAGEALLDTYEQERRAIAHIDADISVRNAIGKDSLALHPPAPYNVIGPGRGQVGKRLASGEVTVDQVRADIAAAMEPQMQPEQLNVGSDLMYAYPAGALVPDSTAPAEISGLKPSGRPGERAPHVILLRDGEPISSLDLFGDRFVLLTVPEQTDVWRQAAEHAVVEVEVVGVGSDVGDPQNLFSWLYGVDDGAVLIRPDGHIAWRSAGATSDAIATLSGVVELVLARMRFGDVLPLSGRA